jgi:hypothetical protein
MMAMAPSPSMAAMSMPRDAGGMMKMMARSSAKESESVMLSKK